MKPFQIVWELVEFGLQALFLYILAIILIVGMIFGVIYDKGMNRNPQIKPIEKIEQGQGSMAEGKECTRIQGCRVLEDGTIEW
jgi:hypothetical protein